MMAHKLANSTPALDRMTEAMQANSQLFRATVGKLIGLSPDEPHPPIVASQRATRISAGFRSSRHPMTEQIVPTGVPEFCYQKVNCQQLKENNKCVASFCPGQFG
jgi:hypothetical protein